MIFITGTDTGVGKTLLTVLLVHYLRATGVNTLGIKLFCSGSRKDVELIQAAQKHALPTKLVTPFYFSEPLAPLVAAKKHQREIRLRTVLQYIRRVAALCDCLVIEGVGGLLVPLGTDYFVADIIANLPCRVVVVARNRMGTLNHTLLTVEMLKRLGKNKIQVVLMGQKKPDATAKTNSKLLARILQPIKVHSIRFLGRNPIDLAAQSNKCKNIKKVLARILQ